MNNNKPLYNEEMRASLYEDFVNKIELMDIDEFYEYCIGDNIKKDIDTINLLSRIG